MTVYEDILAYVDQLVKEHCGIESVWLIGSRANDTYREDSDWDLLVFADGDTLKMMREHKDLKREKIDVLVAYDGVNFEEPWPEVEENGRVYAKSGRLSGLWPFTWEWNQISPAAATYEGAKRLPSGKNERTVKKAVKLWPQEGAA